MDDEALSWFVDNDVAKKLLTVRGVGAVNPWAAWSGRCMWRWTRSLQALGATAADISRQLRQVQRESAGAAPTWAAASSPCAPWPRCRRRRAGRPVAGAVRRPPVRLDQIATVTDTVPSRAPWRCSNGKPVVGFEVAQQGRERSRSGRRRAGGTGRTARQHPGLELTEASTSCSRCRRNTTAPCTCSTKGPAGRAGGVAVPARLARHLCLGVALPLSVIPAFIGMYLLGFPST